MKYFLKNTSFLKQESDSISFHYWSLFDGHAGSGAAVVASKLLQHHIVEQLQEIVDILKNSAVPPPTCLGEEPESMNANSRTLTRAASLRGSVGAPGSPGTPPTRFFTEKKILQEYLVMGAIETAFREMVSILGTSGNHFALKMEYFKLKKFQNSLHLPILFHYYHQSLSTSSSSIMYTHSEVSVD